MQKNLLVGQSGGPTAVINGSLYGVVSEALSHTGEIDLVYGMVNGIDGLLAENFIEMNPLKEDGTLELIKTTPGSYLGSCRHKLPENLEDDLYPEIFKILQSYNIGWFFYIGGNDSMDTVSKLSRYAAQIDSDIRFIGIPKTIDNDLIHTDHTPGYGSAAKYIGTSLLEVIRDAAVYSNKPSVTIVEIMGRDAGWLTASSIAARKNGNPNPMLIYLPETSFDLDRFIVRLQECLKVENNVIVCISEGIHDKDDKLICEYDSAVGTDAFGHKMLAGSAKTLERIVKERLGVKVRSIELNVLQRCSSSCLSACDLNESIQAGATGVGYALQGMTGQMVSFVRKEGREYEMLCEAVDVNEVCNQVKHVPDEYIIQDGSDISEEFLSYLKPLIQGEVDVPFEEGLPVFASR